MQYFYSLALIILSGLFSGLTLGLLSLSPFELNRKSELGDVDAAKVYPIRSKGNQLLVTLLVGNVLVNAALTVILNSVMTGLLAVIISTILITVFGEIVPQAALKKHGLRFASHFHKPIQYLLLLASPISVPIAWILDNLLGEELPTLYSKEELVKIFEEHKESEDSEVEEDELRIVQNALNYGDKLIKDVMTPINVIHSIRADEVIDQELLMTLHDSGFSRFPVAEDGDLNKIVGVLYLRDMILLTQQNPIAKHVDSNRVYYVKENEVLDHALNAFIKTKHHLFVVVNERKETVGVVSIEDIIEEIIGREIVDEFDQYTDLQAVAKRKSKLE